MGKITIFDGAEEIGGTKILLEIADKKVFVDFGLNYKRHSEFFEFYLNPRISNGIGDIYFLGLVPQFRGLYRDDLLEMLNKEGNFDLGTPDEEPSIDAVFISHAHFDHSAYTSFIRGDIPIYFSDVTLTILKAMEKSGNSSFETAIFDYIRRGRAEKERGTHLVYSLTSKEIIGDLAVYSYPVDHSVKGARGFVFSSPEGALVYSGDLRLHGKRKNETLHFAEEASRFKPEYLIIEGTNVSENESSAEFWTEQRVFDEADRIFKHSEHLVIVDFSIRDIDRFMTFFALAQKYKRKFVITLRDAYLLNAMKSFDDELPSINHPDLCIYLEKRVSGTYSDSDYNSKWMKELLSSCPNLNIVKASDIRNNDKDFVLILRFYDLQELIDLRPSYGSVYIHSTSEAHSEEQEFDQQRLDNWLRQFNLYPKVHIHASGHAKEEDIFKIVDIINPKKIIPVHTEGSERFFSHFGNRVKIFKNRESIDF